MTIKNRKQSQLNILDPPPPPPLLTLLLMMLCAVVGSHMLCHNHGNLNSISVHAFTANKFFDLVSNHNYLGLAGLLYNATFAQLTQWLFVLNVLFIWIFGSVVEKKLRFGKYLLFVLVGICASWTFIALDTQFFFQSKMFIGPLMFIFYLLGGYLAFFPKKPFKPVDWIRPTWKIFRDDQLPEVWERYWVSPWLYIVWFAFYAVLLQYSLSVTPEQIVNVTSLPLLGDIHRFLLGRFDSPDAVAVFRVLPALQTLLLGAVFAYILPLLVFRPRTKRPGGELQLEAIQHYKELRSLDLSHEAAIEGAAKFTAVPFEVAKDWIAKGTPATQDKRH